jgi:hypothetical protein
MPARPPETEFYDNYENFKLWRDVSRLFEDWAPFDAPERTERFMTVLQDINNRLRASGIDKALEENDAASSNG